MDRRKAKGRIGEAAAEKHLVTKGFICVDRNWRCRTGEIDLVMKHGDALVFVEVRTTSSNRFGLGYETVDYRKQLRLKQLATIYMHFRKVDEMRFQLRFDVVSVLIDQNERVLSIKHIPNAF